MEEQNTDPKQPQPVDPLASETKVAQPANPTLVTPQQQPTPQNPPINPIYPEAKSVSSTNNLVYDQPQDTTDKPKARSSIIKLIILLILVIVIGGGVFAYKHFNSKNTSTVSSATLTSANITGHNYSMHKIIAKNVNEYGSSGASTTAYISFDKNATEQLPNATIGNTDLQGNDLQGNKVTIVFAAEAPPEVGTSLCEIGATKEFPASEIDHSNIGTVSILSKSETMCGLNMSSTIAANNQVIIEFSHGGNWFRLTFTSPDASQSVDLGSVKAIAASLSM